MVIAPRPHGYASCLLNSGGTVSFGFSAGGFSMLRWLIVGHGVPAARSSGAPTLAVPRQRRARRRGGRLLAFVLAGRSDLNCRHAGPGCSCPAGDLASVGGALRGAASLRLPRLAKSVRVQRRTKANLCWRGHRRSHRRGLGRRPYEHVHQTGAAVLSGTRSRRGDDGGTRQFVTGSANHDHQAKDTGAAR